VQIVVYGDTAIATGEFVYAFEKLPPSSAISRTLTWLRPFGRGEMLILGHTLESRPLDF
jgi:hypothetical protein